jgi:hypothetical protein
MQVVSSTGTTTLTAAITTTGQTAISVAASQNLAAGVVIQIDSELLQITSVTGLNLVVTRAFNGTSAATHLNAATVTILAGIKLKLLDSTTAQPKTSFAVAFNQIRIDGTVLSGGSSTACTTDSWGSAWLFLSLSGGPHDIDCQTTSTLPFSEPCFYVGPIGTIALTNAGLNLQIAGNVAGSISGTQFTSNLVFANVNTSILTGQILTFTSGVNANKSYIIAGSQNSSGSLRLTMETGWISNPSAGDAFALSNVATANAMTVGFEQVPGIGQIIDQGGNGGDGTPIVTASGVVAASVASGKGADAASVWEYLQDILVQVGAWPTPQTFTAWPATYHIPYSQGYQISVYAGSTLVCSFGNNLAAGDILTLSYNTTSHVLTVTSANGVSFPTYTEPGVTSVTITGEESGPIYGVAAGDANGNVCATQAFVTAAIAADPAAVIAALIAAGVLQYVSGSSGPLQFTPTAVAHVPTPAVVNISTEDTIEEHNPRREYQ